MVTEKHPNSYEVKVKRLVPFNHEAQDQQQEWFKNTSRAIGSYFQGGGSKKVATGLSVLEVDELMPMLVNAENTDKDFRRLVENYFIEINTKVPHEGLTLEVGKKIDNNKPILFKDEDGKMVKNFPIDVEDYIKYKHAIGAPNVKPTEAEGKSDPTAWFYVIDENKEVTQAAKTQSAIDAALGHYLNIKDDERKVAMYLTLLGEVVKDINPNLRASTLKQHAETNPGRFVETVTDDNATLKYQINRLVTSGIVNKEGTRYLFEGTQLASSLLDFVEYMKDAANSETVGILKARYKNLGTN
jgi:hypothetical protein